MNIKIFLGALGVVFLTLAGYLYLNNDKLKSQNQDLSQKLTKTEVQIQDKAEQTLSAEEQKQLVEIQLKYEQAKLELETLKAKSSLLAKQYVSKDGNDYKTVKLTTGEIFYGIIKAYDSEYLVLEDIYYIQGHKDFTESGTESQPQISLVKRGNELDASEDKMLIKVQTVITVETLKETSQVKVAIIQSKTYR